MSANIESLIAAKANNIPDAFYKLAKADPSAVLFSQAQAETSDSSSRRVWKNSTAGESVDRVNKIARYLRSLGLAKGDRAAVISGTRPEWMEADLAILAEGGVSVSVYQSLPPDDIAYILYDSSSEIIFAENQEQLEKLLSILSRPVNIPATEDRAELSAEINIKKIIAFEEVDPHPLVMQLDEILSEDKAQNSDKVDSIVRDDLAALVYTSGTTGPPKGVMQTHGNHLANVRQTFESGIINEHLSICLFLPLAHSFAKLIGYQGFTTPVVLYFPAIVDSKSSALSPQSMAKDISECNANIFPVVPRLLEKMRDKVAATQNKPGIQGKLVGLTINSAKTVFEANKTSGQAPLLSKVAYFLTKPLREKIKRTLFGANFKFCLSGGAKLSTEVSEFFWSLGIPVVEGYGLTETTVACNVGYVDSTPIGSVGPALAKDIEILIQDDGELCFRGPNVAIGYYNRKTATENAWDKDGWFHTGDLGSLDEHGNLRIVGRKKELIVTSGGKNIAPNDIEGLIKTCEYVSQAVLIGDGRKYCIALVSLSPEETKRWAERNYISDFSDLHNNEQLKKEIWNHVQEVNKTLASYETVKKIHIVPEDFSVENGQLTPTFKIKRSVVEDRYKSEINLLY